MAEKRERLTQFADLIDKICEEKKLQKKELEVILGLGPTSLSQIGRRWEEHWQVFKKIVLEVYPMGLYDDPLDVEPVLRHILEMHQSLPEDYRDDFWRQVREVTEKKYHRTKFKSLHHDQSNGQGHQKRRAKRVAGHL